jgi:hypothetical protein
MAGAGIAGLTVAGPVRGRARGQSGVAPPEGEIQVRRTYAERTYAQEAPLRWQTGGAPDRSVIRLELDPEVNLARDSVATLTWH